MKEIQKALEIAEGWTGTEEFACEIHDLLVAALPQIEALRAENERLRALMSQVLERDTCNCGAWVCNWCNTGGWVLISPRLVKAIRAVVKEAK